MEKCVINHGFDFGVLNWLAMGGMWIMPKIHTSDIFESLANTLSNLTTEIR